MTDDSDAALVKELKDNAARLGLIWQLVPATVEDPTIPTVTFDSDSTGLPCPVINILATPIAGDRVWIAQVPPAGNYMIGRQPLPDPAHMGIVNYNAALTAGTTTSASFANLPSNPTMTLTKAYLTTRIRVDLHVIFYSSLANTGAQFAVSVGGFDGPVCQRVVNAANTYAQCSGTALFPFPASGPITIIGRWNRYVGGGTISTDTASWFSMTAQEVI